MTHLATMYMAPTYSVISIRRLGELRPVKELLVSVMAFKMRVYPSGRFFILASNNTVGVCDLNGEYRELFNLKGLSCIDVSSDGMMIAAGSSQGVVEIWAVPYSIEAKLEKMCTFKKHSGAITSLCFQPGVPAIVSGGADQLIYYWHVVAGKELQCYEGHTSEITALMTLTNGVCFSGSGVRDTTAKMWDPETGAEILSTPALDDGSRITAIALDSRLGYLFLGTTTGFFHAWSLVQQRWVVSKWLFEAAVTVMTDSVADNIVAIGCANGNMYFVDTLNPDDIRLEYEVPGGILGAQFCRMPIEAI